MFSENEKTADEEGLKFGTLHCILSLSKWFKWFMFKSLDDEWFGVIFEKEKRLLNDSFSDAAHLGSKWVVKKEQG